MQVLVTGGGGFVGGYLVDLLLERGYAVRIGRSPQPRLIDKGVDFRQADLADLKAVNDAVAGGCSVSRGGEGWRVGLVGELLRGECSGHAQYFRCL